MKRIILIVLAIVFSTTLSFAAPFLVADIPPEEWVVTEIRGEVDGTPFVTPYTLQSGGVLIYDIGTLSPARHNFTNLKFVNIRGEGPTLPFVLPALPGSLSNTRLRP